ncbi:MAG: CHAD domain-containing protein [Beijerinckiaceae bacterium]|nr:CHAD domain-containing protein [Beijerinckiaceae bacterium]
MSVTDGEEPSILSLADSSREIEVKLEAKPSVLRGASELPLFAGVAFSRSRTFRTTYFDTADNALSHAGMSLRVRSIGRRRMLTFKWPPKGAEGIFARGEVEVAIQGDAPHPEMLGPEADALIAQTTAGMALEPRSQTTFGRRVALIEHKGASIEAALDVGRIQAGGRKAVISELELELKQGDPAALYDFARRFMDYEFRVTAAPKGLRGHWLATGVSPAEVRARKPVLLSKASIDDAIAAILDANLKQFVANWPAFSPHCPEAVHQMRVALRRLRSALGIFSKIFPYESFLRFRMRAKEIASAMGEAREQDVLRELVDSGPARALEGLIDFKPLVKASDKKRAAAYAHVRALLDAPDTSRFVLELQEMISRREWRAGEDNDLAMSAVDFAKQALNRLDKRAHKRGKNLVELPPEARHETRIALKNLRYASDFFLSLFGKSRRSKKFQRAIGDLQEALGAYNDSVVARATVAEIQRVAGAAGVRAAGVVDGWTARGAADADAHLGVAWKAFRKAPRFWR